MGVPENIKKLRERYGLTQQELADIAGVTNKAVSAWETGQKEPRMGPVERIAKRFGLKKSNIIDDGGMDIVDEFQKTPIFTPDEFSASAKELIRKFEVLDDKGQHTVNTVLNIEYERCTNHTEIVPAQTPEKQQPQYDEIITMAAHQVGHEGPLTPDQMDQIKRAMQNALAKRDQ